MVTLDEMQVLDLLSRIGKQAGLSAAGARRFMKLYFDFKGKKEAANGGPIDQSYAMEWAKRFAKQEEYVLCDGANFRRLIEIDGEAEGHRKFVVEHERKNWPAADIEEKWQRMAGNSGSARKSKRCRCTN